MPTDPDEVDAKRRYNAVLSAIKHQTSSKQRPGVRPSTIYLVCVGHGQYTRSGVKASLQQALDNGDAIVYRDAAGDLRFIRFLEADLRRLVTEHPELRDHDRIANALEVST